jgi:hypothetical protein
MWFSGYAQDKIFLKGEIIQKTRQKRVMVLWHCTPPHCVQCTSYALDKRKDGQGGDYLLSFGEHNKRDGGKHPKRHR